MFLIVQVNDNYPFPTVAFATLFFLSSHYYCLVTLVAKQLHSLFFHIFLVMPLFFLSAFLCFLHTGPPTKFGLAESLRARVEQQRAVVPTLSVYKASYPLHPISAFCHSRHVSMPKRISSSQRPANHSNEDLALKHRPYRQVSSNPARLL